MRSTAAASEVIDIVRFGVGHVGALLIVLTDVC